MSYKIPNAILYKKNYTDCKYIAIRLIFILLGKF